MIWSEQKKTKEEHRQSLIHLISAYYGEQNYDSAVSTFWEYYDEFGFEGLGEDTKLDVRVSIAMNPFLGAFETGIKNGLKVLPCHESDSFWIVGTDHMCRVKIDLNTRYIKNSKHLIHDYKIGRKPPPGGVIETISFPGSIASGEAVFLGHRGEIWVGVGTAIYKYDEDNTRWTKVIDSKTISHSDLSLKYGVEKEKHDEMLDFMNGEGRHFQITGLALTRDESRAVLALGGDIVCLIDVREQRSLGWFQTQMGSFTGTPIDGGFPRLKLSPDERHLLYRGGSASYMDEGQRYVGASTSFIFVLSMSDFYREAYYYGRDFDMLDMVFSDTNNFFGLISEGLVFSVNTNSFDEFGEFNMSMYVGKWDPGSYPHRQFRYKNSYAGALSLDGMSCCLLTEKNRLIAGRTRGDLNFDIECRIQNKNVVDLSMRDDGLVLVLEDSGRVSIYDTRRYSTADIDDMKNVVDVCWGADQDTLYVLVDTDSEEQEIYKLSGVSEPPIVKEKILSTTNCINICSDPLGRYIVAASMTKAQVYDLNDEQIVAVINSKHSKCGPVKFDERGEYLQLGGDWSRMFMAVRVRDWKVVWRGFGPGCNGLVIESAVDNSTVAMIAKGWEIFCVQMDEINEGNNKLLWKNKLSGTVLSIIPYNDKKTGNRRLWARTWFDYFVNLDAATGEDLSEVQRYWTKKGIKDPFYDAGHGLIGIPLQNGSLNVALRVDLYPILDSRIFREDVEVADFFPDGSALATVSKEGFITIINLPAEEFTKYRSKTVDTKYIESQASGLPWDAGLISVSTNMQLYGQLSSGWSVSKCAPWGLPNPNVDPGLHEELLGRTNVLATHPINENTPCMISRNVTIPETQQAILKLTVGHHPRGDWDLGVRISGKEVFLAPVSADTATNGWMNVSIDLSQYSGQSICIELLNIASGWNHEAGYWDKIEINYQ